MYVSPLLVFLSVCPVSFGYVLADISRFRDTNALLEHYVHCCYRSKYHAFSAVIRLRQESERCLSAMVGGMCSRVFLWESLSVLMTIHG